MPRKKSPALTDAEVRLMRVLWDRGRATVGDVIDGLHERPKPAYNTALTLLGILERKGYVRHEKAGRAFVFVPRIDRGRARHRALRHLLNRFFDDSAEQLVLNLLEHDDLDTRALARVRALIERSEAADHGSR